MNSKIGILVKNLLLSTSTINVLKYEKNQRKRNKAMGMIILEAVLFVMLSGYTLVSAFNYGMMGLASIIPLLLAIILSGIAAVFAFLEVNGYLFAFKDYDILMSLPFKIKDVVSAKFIYMYLKRLPWYLAISICLEIPYIYYAKPGIASIIMWIVGSLVIPVIPMLIATALGTVILGISIKFKHKQIVEIILSMLLLAGVFVFETKLTSIAPESDINEILKLVSVKLEAMGNYFPPIMWFQNCVVNRDIVSLLLLLLCSFVLFEILFIVISRFYKQINARLMSGISIGKYELGAQTQRSCLTTLIRKEWGRFTSSSLYFMNAGMGLIMGLVLPIIALFVNIDDILKEMNLPMQFTLNSVIPVAPVAIGLLLSMCTTSCMSPSLEGKNYWILQSLPLSRKTINKSKLLFNVVLQLPVSVIANLCIGIALKAGIVNTLLYELCGIGICIFTSSIGIIIGIKFIRLDWENEIEIIKQGLTVAIYLLPSLVLFLGLIVGVFYLGTILGTLSTLLVTTLTISALGIVLYKYAISL